MRLQCVSTHSGQTPLLGSQYVGRIHLGSCHRQRCQRIRRRCWNSSVPPLPLRLRTRQFELRHSPPHDDQLHLQSALRQGPFLRQRRLRTRGPRRLADQRHHHAAIRTAIHSRLVEPEHEWLRRQPPDLGGNREIDNKTLQRWFDPAAFARPNEIRFGNLGRNISMVPDASTSTLPCSRTSSSLKT